MSNQIKTSRFRRVTQLWTEFNESFGMAMSAIAAHKLRSCLTLLGVLVGVFSIVVVMTAMRVLQQNVEKELSELGANTFQVQRWPVIQMDGPAGWEKYRRRKRITYALAQQLEDRATLAQAVAVETGFGNGEAVSRYEKTNPDVSLTGVSPASFQAKNWTVRTGRALLQSDVDSARNVCVLGANLAKKLFPQGGELGERVQFYGLEYTVVGVLDSRGTSMEGNQDNFLAIPITTGLNQFGRERDVAILVQAGNAEVFEDTVEQTRGILRALRKVPPGDADDFEVFSNDSLIEQFRTLTLAVRIGVAVISSVALIAAGIGIMNIMLVSVTERTREIGIRRAVGARKGHIMTQFILEAVILCEVGGAIGVFLGMVGGNITALVMQVAPVLPLDWMIFGLLLCSGVGIVFGTYPAWKAANLDPIDSLRYE